MMELNIDEKKGTLTIKFTPANARKVTELIKGLWEFKEQLQETVLEEMKNMTPEERINMAASLIKIDPKENRPGDDPQHERGNSPDGSGNNRQTG